MTKFTALIQAYLNTWNETDPTARKEAIREVWEVSGRYSDPLAVAQGHEEIDRTIAAVQQQFPAMTFELLGEIDAHGDQARFRWQLGAMGKKPVAIGFDVMVTGQRGKVQSVLGFLDQIPSKTPEGVESPRSYAVGLLTDAHMGDDLTQYLRRIDDTLAPYSGKFLIHGASPAQVEGQWIPDLIVIEFPKAHAARAWYSSEAYQAILPLRTDNATGIVALFEGVEHPHKATDILAYATTSRSNL